ncbi:MAG: hypothetical protein N3D17_02190 [bacterium]|nr:hypothetical protein [bacterium]
MRRMFLVAVLVGIVFSLRAEVNKEEFFARMLQKNSNVECISGKYEINMSMMGNIMKIPVNFWQKGNKMRMDMIMSNPGMPQPMEIYMLMDGQKMIQYQKMLKTVFTFDLEKLPENMKQQMKNNQGFIMNSDSISQLYQMIDKISVEEKIKDGKSFYLISIRDISNTGNISSTFGVQSTQQMFNKMLMWVNPSSLLPEKIEFYGDTDTPAMWIDILGLSTEPFSDSVFKLDIPADVKYMDMTETMKKMSESVNVR